VSNQQNTFATTFLESVGDCTFPCQHKRKKRITPETRPDTSDRIQHLKWKEVHKISLFLSFPAPCWPSMSLSKNTTKEQ